MTRFALLLAFALAAAGCDQLVSPSHYGEVHIEAKSPTGAPAPGLQVELYTGIRPMAYGETDADGLLHFAYVPAGPAYGVAARAPDGWGFRETYAGGPRVRYVSGFPVLRDSVYRIQLTLHRNGPGTIHTVVMDDAGNTVPDVLVTLYTGTGIVSVRPTDAAGRVTFRDVQGGPEHGVSAERPAAYRHIFAEERVYSAPHRIVMEGDSLNATLTFTRNVVSPAP